MGINCDTAAPHPALQICFYFVTKQDFMLSLSRENQVDVTQAFNSNSRYLEDDILKIDNDYFSKVLQQIRFAMSKIIENKA